MNFRSCALLALLTSLVFCASAAFGQVYSYVDENGTRVLTNIAPSGQVTDLKVRGALPDPPPVPNPLGKNARLVQSQSPAASRPGLGGSVKVAPTKSIAPPSGRREPVPANYDALVEKYAAEFSLDPKLLRSMIATESGYNSGAVSPKGAQGLMQLMPETAARLGVSNPFDPEENIWGGARYMRFLLDTFAENAEDNLILSLAAYNAGENVVQRLGRVPDYRETNDYVRSIIERYGKRQMDVPPSASVIPVPATYRYFDEKGVLILTNIPPVDHSQKANGNGPNSINR